jgi:hypothetical protein
VTVPSNAATPRRTRRGSALWLVVLSALFLAGPTPGDVGGCGGTLANTSLPGNPDEQQYDYFEQGFCANMCLRLRSCGVLCLSLQGAGADCLNDSQQAYQQCLRGQLRPGIFGSNQCPHSCGNYGARYAGASEQDVQVCGHAINALSCDAIADVIRQPPGECLAVCVP